jgi:hypothetical protein
MMTLFKVTVLSMSDACAAPLVLELMRPGPAIHHPPVGASFAVVDDEGRAHRGVIVEIEDLGISRGGDKPENGGHAAVHELRTLRVTIEQRSAVAACGCVH